MLSLSAVSIPYLTLMRLPIKQQNLYVLHMCILSPPHLSPYIAKELAALARVHVLIFLKRDRLVSGAVQVTWCCATAPACAPFTLGFG